MNIEKITILPGFDKSGNAEMPDMGELTLHKGSVTSIVGPTGSGKSRLLADIEWIAQGDTPTKRRILIDGKALSIDERFSLENKLVAQLSQNMNFVMDVTVSEFIKMHAESRNINNEDIIDIVVNQANELAGEKFDHNTPLTALSGGQSRALMIADTASLSASPVVLIDEIENAGIDRKNAISLLMRNEKIVLMATHDPILALMADKRLVIRNGGVMSIIERTDKEKSNLGILESYDAKMMSLRQRMRSGELIENIDL